MTKAALEANGIIDAAGFLVDRPLQRHRDDAPAQRDADRRHAEAGDEGGISVRLVVLGRTVEAIDTFIEHLEQTGRFANVLAVAEQVTEEGLFQTTIEGGYRDVPTPPGKTAAPAAAAPTAAGGAP